MASSPLLAHRGPLPGHTAALGSWQAWVGTGRCAIPHWQHLPRKHATVCRATRQRSHLANYLQAWQEAAAKLPASVLKKADKSSKLKDTYVPPEFSQPGHGIALEKGILHSSTTLASALVLQHHPCMQLIMQRAAAGSKPGRRAAGDTAKIGLVVEGGGMRGVVSGAMLMALHALGLRDSFDVVYGASAGAINSTYFLTGQSEGLGIYAEELTGTRFINPHAMLQGGKLMDLDYLIDHIMQHVRPLDWHGVLSSPLPLKVVASSLDTLQPVLLEGWQNRHDLVECLKASALVPEVAGPPRMCRGHRLVDAAVFEPVPVQSALKDGCTHVLVLCTRPATSTRSHLHKAFQGTLAHLVKQTLLNAPYMQPAWSSPICSQADIQDEKLVTTLLEHPNVTHEKMGGYVLPVYPTSTAGCHPITTCPRTIRSAAAEGLHAITSLFGGDHLVTHLVHDPDHVRSEEIRSPQCTGSNKDNHSMPFPAWPSNVASSAGQRLQPIPVLLSKLTMQQWQRRRW